MMDAARSLTDRHVLVVEDDYFIMDELRLSFEQSGATVLGPVGSVEEALAIAKDSPRIDAAVLDINLHGEMAFPVADALRTRGVPIIFATGYDAVTIPERFADALHCEKPVEPDMIARLILSRTGGVAQTHRAT
ncbi:response regulator [Methylobacterium radiodurans]|uniref:Response regulatory domain-containing protein n=1 Tax=Methylobacterium radiodurans TaxID=2202828 RepID=A0A2U8W016_9HYPH|nr:response regulator [Methylobacterium radiodurans]AWN38802.1 hypothetical protein DK427_02785 [Methylobacterium radiodurans]